MLISKKCINIYDNIDKLDIMWLELLHIEKRTVKIFFFILYNKINFLRFWKFIFVGKINVPFCLRIAPNLTTWILVCMEILPRKINKNFLLNFSYRKIHVLFDAFSKWNGSFFSSQRKCSKAKLLNFSQKYFQKKIKNNLTS